MKEPSKKESISPGLRLGVSGARLTMSPWGGGEGGGWGEVGRGGGGEGEGGREDWW